MEADVQRIDDEERVVLSMTRRELFLLAGAINETIDAVDDWEFASRLGTSKDDARGLRLELRRIISELPPDAG